MITPFFQRNSILLLLLFFLFVEKIQAQITITYPASAAQGVYGYIPNPSGVGLYTQQLGGAAGMQISGIAEATYTEEYNARYLFSHPTFTNSQITAVTLKVTYARANVAPFSGNKSAIVTVNILTCGYSWNTSDGPTLNSIANCIDGTTPIQTISSPNDGDYSTYTNQYLLHNPSLGVDNSSYWSSTGTSLEIGLESFQDAMNISSMSLIITYIPLLPTVSIIPQTSTTICQGGNVILNTSATGTGLTYLWTAPAGAASGVTNASYTASVSGVYTVKVTNNQGGTATSSTTVIVNPLPTATITIPPGSSTSFCPSGNVTLNASPGTSYQWNYNRSAMNGTNSASYNTSTAGSYSVTVTNSYGCSATSAITTITVYSLPYATITPTGSPSICQGTNLVLNANAGNTGVGLNYLWNVPAGATTGVTSTSYIASEAGNYSVTVSSNYQCGAAVTSPITTLNLKPVPTAVITTTTPTTFCAGGSVILSASTSTGTGLTYLWNVPLGATTGVTSANYNATIAGAYTVTVSSSDGCSATSMATSVIVNPIPTALITPIGSGSTTFCQGGSVTLGSFYNTLPGLSYQWFNNGVTIPNATSPTCSTSVSGAYTVTLTASGCSATSSSEIVTVNPLPPSPTITQAAPNSAGYVELSTTPQQGYSYEWYNNGNPANGGWTQTDLTGTLYNGVYGSMIVSPNGTVYATNYDTTSKSIFATSYVNGQGWVGAALPNSAQLNGNFYAPLALNPVTNLPYVAYINSSSQIVVMSYNGGTWVNVGIGIPVPYYAQICLAIDASGNSYVALGAYTQNIAVWKYSGGSWLNISPASGFTEGTTMSMAINPGNSFPYIAFTDNSNAQKASVIMYNGANWSYAGNAGFSVATAKNFSLAFNSSAIPYVAYSDFAYGGNTSVMQLTGASWVPVGAAGSISGSPITTFLGFTGASGAMPFLTFDPNGVPYVGNTFVSNSLITTSPGQTPLPITGIMAYNGASWEYVAPVSSSTLGYNYYVGFDASGYIYTTAISSVGIYRSDIMKYKIADILNGGASYLTTIAGNYSVVSINNSTGCQTTSASTTVTSPSVFINTPLNARYEAGQPVPISYAAGITFNSGNVFTAQLSDASGSFTSPAAIGTVTATTGGALNATIPSAALPSINYRMRIVSSNPATVGPDNGVNIAINNSAGSLLFSTGDMVVVPNNAVYNFSTDFTLEAWVKLPSTENYIAPAIISSRNDNTTWQGLFFSFFSNNGTGNNNDLNQLLVQINGVNYVSNIFPTIDDNNCHHVAVTRASGLITFYLDGVSVGTQTCTSAISSTTPLYIGYDIGNGSSQSYLGTIDDVRMWNKANSAATIAANRFLVVPGNSPGLVGYWDFNETSGQVVYDQSVTANNGSLGTNPTAVDAADPARVEGVKCFTPALESGLTFSGASPFQRATVPANADYNFGTGDFTIEGWVNLSTTQNAGAPAIASNRISPSSGVYNGFLFTPYNGTQLLLQVAGINYLSPTGAITTSVYNGSCHHIAVARLSGELQFYVDGNPVGTTVGCAGSISNSGALYLGYDIVDNASITGNINELRIWNANRTAAQISGSMSAVLSPNTSNLIGYWRLNESGDEIIYDQSVIANNGYLGTNQFEFDPANPIRSSNACFSGDRLSGVSSIPHTIDSSRFNNSIADVVKIYPNPTSGGVTIDFNYSQSQIVQVQVLDLLGKEIYSENLGTIRVGQTVANLSSQAAGIYIVQITSGSTISTQKLSLEK